MKIAVERSEISSKYFIKSQLSSNVLLIWPSSVRGSGRYGVSSMLRSSLNFLKQLSKSRLTRFELPPPVRVPMGCLHPTHLPLILSVVPCPRFPQSPIGMRYPQLGVAHSQSAVKILPPAEPTEDLESSWNRLITWYFSTPGLG